MDNLSKPVYQEPSLVKSYLRWRDNWYWTYLLICSVCNAILVAVFAVALDKMLWGNIVIGASTLCIRFGWPVTAKLATYHVRTKYDKRKQKWDDEILRRQTEAQETVYAVTGQSQSEDGILSNLKTEYLHLVCRSFEKPSEPAFNVDVPLSGARWFHTDRKGTVVRFSAATIADDGMVGYGKQAILMSARNDLNLPAYSPVDTQVPSAADDPMAWLNDFK